MDLVRLQEALLLMGPGFAMTLAISASVMALGLVVGVAGGLVLAYGPLPARLLVRGYVDIVRGVPLLVLIFVIFYGLPSVGVRLPAVITATIALGAWVGGHVSEITRGGINAVPAGQSEAATALGIRFTDRLRHVVFGQAVRSMLPPLVNTTIEAVKATSLVSLVSIVDLTLATSQVISRVGDPVPLYILAGTMYSLVAYAVSLAGRRLELRYST
jgi:polar amino acid transport system permease protein